MEKRKIIMDVDTGSDDAIALCMAMLDPDFELLGIMTVNGNLECRLCTENTLQVVECCKKQGKVKVYRGCEYPLASTLLPYLPQAKLMPIREGHNPYSGHPEHLPLPLPKIKEEEKSAVIWLVETLMASEDGEITLVPVGPLTNIATAIRADHRIIPKIREIVLMGGGHERGNESAAGEFNVWADPEAAEIVLQSGCPITIVPLDATEVAVSTREDGRRFREIGTPAATLCADLIDIRIDEEIEFGNTDETTAINDALALCAVLHPEVLKEVKECSVHVDISRGFAYGYTIMDTRRDIRVEKPNCRFALRADREAFFEYMYRILKEDKERRDRQ